jgi:hypothetical protein
VCLTVVCCATSPAAAAEPAARPYHAAICVAEYDPRGAPGETWTADIEAAAGNPSWVEIAAVAGRSMQAKVQRVPNTAPPQFTLEARVSRGNAVLMSPKLRVVSGKNAMMTVRLKDSGRLEISIAVIPGSANADLDAD